MFNPSKIRKIEIAYIAGLLDGEGSFQFRLNKQVKKEYPRIVIKMNAGEWEEEIKKLNIGKIYTKQGKYQEQTAWYLYKQRDIIQFLQVITPYLHVKKQQAYIMLCYLQAWALKRLCRVKKRKE